MSGRAETKRLVVGPGASLGPAAGRALAGRRRLALVSEPRAWGLFGRGVKAALERSGAGVSVFMLPRGEAAKTWTRAGRLLSGLARAGLGRDSGLVALGGGAVTDPAGFAAAVYMRGIPWVSVPTTLLGQLDSGIGGKTGVNLAGRKNLAGAFHMPAAVVCDTAMLATLPRRELVSGLAEAVKTGLVLDPALWRFIQAKWAGLAAGSEPLLREAVRRTAAWKARVVAADERETTGRRELLNFGHTLGHALEGAAGLKRVSHGDAVLWGMRAALRLSRRHAGMAAREAALVEGFLAAIQPSLPRVSASAVLAAARSDKKARRGRPRFVLLSGLGRPKVSDRVPGASVREAVEALL